MSTTETPSAAAPPALKRPHSSTDDDDDDDVCVKQRYFYLFAPESTDYSSDGPESIYSVQAKSTDLARDTSDTCSKDSWNNSDASRMFELEVVSLDDSDAAFPLAFSSSAPEDIAPVPSPSSKPAGAATTRSSRSADGSEVECAPVNNKLRTAGPHQFCTICKNVNSDPHFMYCVKCHRLKKNYQPDRPRKQQKTDRPQRRRHASDEPEDSGIASLSSADSLVAQLPPPPPVPGQSSAPAYPLCRICVSRPQDGGFCHGKITHVYCCYRCSVKTFKQRGRCPVCNRKPISVSKIIIA